MFGRTRTHRRWKQANELLQDLRDKSDPIHLKELKSFDISTVELFISPK